MNAGARVGARDGSVVGTGVGEGEIKQVSPRVYAGSVV